MARKFDVRLIQKSLLCGFKGFENFIIGSLVAVNGAILEKGGYAEGRRKRREGLYGIYNNIVPAIETLICMGVICPLLSDYLLKFVPGLQNSPSIRMIIGLFTSLALMMSICALLRVTGKRLDCCDDYDHKAGFSTEDGYAAHFKIPANEERRNSLQKFINLGCLSFDRWCPEGEPVKSVPVEDGSDDDSSTSSLLGEEGSSSVSSLSFHFFCALTLCPFFLMLLVLNIVELPVVLLFDLFALCAPKKSGGKEALKFAGSRDVLKQMTFNVFQLMQPFLCFAPSANAKVGAGLQRVVDFIGGIRKKARGAPGECSVLEGTCAMGSSDEGGLPGTKLGPDPFCTGVEAALAEDSPLILGSS